jgi:head-to-tail connecting protein
MAYPMQQRNDAPQAMPTDRADKICKRLTSLKSLRIPHEDVWRRCFEYTYPLRANGLSGDIVDAESGQNKKAKQTDSTGTEAVRTLASAIMSGLTPANSRWFELQIGSDDTDEDKRYLSDAADTIWKNIHASNFDSEAYEGVIDAVCAGWFTLYVDAASQGGYEFQLWPMGQCYPSSSKPGGVVDTIYRCYELTAVQAVAEFGENAVSDAIRKASVDAPDTKFEFVHAIEPRKTYAVGARLAKNLPFSSCHVELKSKKLVRESGYHEFPCVVPRWQLLPGTAYAVGPVFDALPDIAMINEVRRLELMNLDMAIAGMWIAEDDGVLNPRSVKVGPRKVIVANSVDSMKELRSSTDFNVAFMSEDRIQAQIRKILLADQLQPQDGPAMTATEVHARINLIRQLLGPIYGRLQSEYLKPLVERCFGIAFRAGVLGPAPDSLRDREFHIKFISPLARAQKLEEVSAIDQYVAGLMSVAEATQDPSVMDNVDLDAAARFRGEALGVPQSIIPKPDDIAKRRKMRLEAQQQAQQQQQAMELQQTAGEAAIKQSVGAK